MQPVRATGHDLQRLHRRACGRQHRKGVGLGVKRLHCCRAGPMASDAFEDAKPRRIPDAAIS